MNYTMNPNIFEIGDRRAATVPTRNCDTTCKYLELKIPLIEAEHCFCKLFQENIKVWKTDGHDPVILIRKCRDCRLGEIFADHIMKHFSKGAIQLIVNGIAADDERREYGV